MARGASTAAERGVTNWRIKSRDRFADPELVAVRYESGLREVFDYHEAICDLIDAARRNEVCVSLLTLARIIHDDDGFQAPEWHERRAWMFAALRSHGLIEFEGSVESIHQQLTISLPEATYVKWHTDGGAKSAKAKAQPRIGGKFATAKPPQVQAVPDCGDRKGVAVPQAPRRHDTTDDTTRHDDTADLRPQTARRTWQDEVLDELVCLHDGDEGKRNHLRSELWMHSRRHNLSDAPHAYVAAAKAFAAKVAGGWKPNRSGGALPYYLSTVTSHRHEITVAEATPEPKEPSPYDRATRIA